MKPTKHENTLSSQTASEIALEKATAHLKAKGIVDPALLFKGDYSALYGEIEAYRKQLAEMIVQFMRHPSGPRPIEEFGTKPCRARVTRDFTGTDYDD